MPEYDYVWSEQFLVVGTVGSIEDAPKKKRPKRKIDRLGGTGFRVPPPARKKGKP